MKVTIGNVTLGIYWRHNFLKRTKNEQGNVISTKLLKNNRWTSCTIEVSKGKDSYEIGVGVALCHKGDVFNKCEGRKLSLAKALDQASNNVNCPVDLNSEQRRKIWEQYVLTTKCSFTVSEKITSKRKHTLQSEAAIQRAPSCEL